MSSQDQDIADQMMPEELGDRLLLQLVAAGNESDLVDSYSLSASDWGIFITGPGGGDWRFDLNAMRFAPAGQACAQRIYCDRVTWNKLIQQQCSVSEALSSGRLLSESDKPKSDSLARSATSCVEQLISRLVEFANHEVLEPQRD